MSLKEELAEFQYEAGIAHKPPHMLRAEQTEALSAEEFAEHTREAFHAFGGSDLPDEQVTATAKAVCEDWQRLGREVTPDRDTAEALAAETRNRLSNASALGALFASGKR